MHASETMLHIHVNLTEMNRPDMQKQVWAHLGGMLLQHNMRLVAELLCRLRPILSAAVSIFGLHVGWEYFHIIQYHLPTH